MKLLICEGTEPSIYSIRSKDNRILLFFSKVCAAWTGSGMAGTLTDTDNGVTIDLDGNVAKLDYMQVEQLGMLLDEYRRRSPGFKYRTFTESK